MEIHFTYEGEERGTLRPDDASYVTRMSAYVPTDDWEALRQNRVVSKALEQELPVTLKHVSWQTDEPLSNLYIDFPEPEDDGIKHVNDVANKFFVSLGWNPM